MGKKQSMKKNKPSDSNYTANITEQTYPAALLNKRAR